MAGRSGRLRPVEWPGGRLRPFRRGGRPTVGPSELGRVSPGARACLLTGSDSLAAASVASPDHVQQRPGCTSSNLQPNSRSAAAAFSRGPGGHARVLDRLPGPAVVSLSCQGPGEPQPLSVRAPAAWPLGSQVGSIAPRPASRHPSQFPEALRPAPTEPPARVSAPPASTVTTWWPFRPEARTIHDLASGPRVGAYQICPAEHHDSDPIAITTSRARARPKRPPPRDRVLLDPIPT